MCECHAQSAGSSPDEESLVYIRPHTPLIEDVTDDDISGHTYWNQSFPLPTPEEKMRRAAQSVVTDVIPINITGSSGNTHSLLLTNRDRLLMLRLLMIN